MSYARFTNSDVYVYMDCNGSLACCGCRLGEDWYFDSTAAMVAHLVEHRAAGHDATESIDAALLADDSENFPESCRLGHVWGEPFRPYPDSNFLASLQRVRCTECDWVDSVPGQLRQRVES